MEKVKSVFKNKNFVLTFLGALVSNIAAIFLNFATSFYILKITDNNAFIQGIFLAVGGLVFVACSIFTGVLSDRFNKAKIMYICDYAKGILIIFGGTLLFVIKNNTIQTVLMFVLTVFLNAIAAIFTPASQSILPFILEEEQLQQGNSYLTGLNSFQSIIGLLLAGLLYSFVPFPIIMIAIGVCYVGSGISEMFIRYEFIPNENKLTFNSVVLEIKDAFKYLKTIEALAIFIVIILFVNFFFAPLDANFLPTFVYSDLAEHSDYLFSSFISPEMWSSLLSVFFCIGGIIGALILSNAKPMDKVAKFIKLQFAILSVFTFVLAVLYFVLVNKNDSVNLFLIVSCALFLIDGIIISFINIPFGTTIYKVCEKSMLGKVQTLINIGSQGLIPLASFLAGICIQYLGNHILLFVCAVGFTITSIVFISLRKTNEL